MARGGARNRSGPQADPSSGRSERRGFKLTALPAEGFTGEVPEFPLPARRVYYTYRDDGAVVRELDESATAAVGERELELWAWAWGTPQACAWSMPSESWRLMTVAMWVRTYVLCESSDATAADKGSLHRFADQVGLTPAGLRENGWAIKADEPVAEESPSQASAPDAGAPPVRRMRVVAGGAS